MLLQLQTSALLQRKTSRAERSLKKADRRPEVPAASAPPYQPLFANPSHTSLVWRATRLTVSKTGAVSVVGVGDDINVTLTGLPRAINGTYTDTTDDRLPNANLYSGRGLSWPRAAGG